MRCLPLLLLLPVLTSASGAEAGWLDWFSRSLREAHARHDSLSAELEKLGTPLIGNTVPQFGYQHLQRPLPPVESPIIQIDLGASTVLDRVALVPALVDFQSMDRRAYGFPRRFRVDVSDDPLFQTFRPILVHTEEDFPNPGPAPVVIKVDPPAARYIRLTATRLAEENGTHFFALAELIALSGNRNAALRCPVTTTNSVNIPPRWNADFLVDGLTPLGPPIQPGRLPEFDALFASETADGGPAWMAVDLGEITPVSEIRLHPLHARQGADVPGFRFPLRYRIEIANREDFSDAFVFHASGDSDLPNPGNNPVTVAGPIQAGRFVRMVCLKFANPEAHDFALSELQVYSGDRWCSQGRRAFTSGDLQRDRPTTLLTDGFTSYGRLMEWPAWLDAWQRRTQLREELQTLDDTGPTLKIIAKRRALLTGGVLSGALLGGAGLLVLRSRRRQRADLSAFRDQLARDLHDEIGSNLAGIAMLSETAARETSATPGDWQEVQRIARESSDAMREVLWLVGARQEMGIELIPQLQLAAARLLSGHTVRWTALPGPLPTAWPVNHRRQVFLFFKEALTNIIKHARATEVELAAELADGQLSLMIHDNGIGFSPTTSTAARGLGMASMRHRAKQLGGTLAFTSSTSDGTRLRLTVPVPP